MELQLDYDFQNDTLFLFNEKLEYKDSIDMDTIIIDFSKDKKVKGIEILDASIFFSEFTGSTISKEMLKEIHKASMDISKVKDMYYMNFGVDFGNEISYTIPLNAPCYV